MKKKQVTYKKCKFCGKGYPANRSDQKFCIPQHAWQHHNSLRLRGAQLLMKVEKKLELNNERTANESEV